MMYSTLTQSHVYFSLYSFIPNVIYFEAHSFVSYTKQTLVSESHTDACLQWLIQSLLQVNGGCELMFLMTLNECSVH
jgi:hypothetical protein